MSSVPSTGSTSVTSRFVARLAVSRFQADSAAVKRKLFIHTARRLPADSSSLERKRCSARRLRWRMSFWASVTSTGSATEFTIHHSHSFSTAWDSLARRSTCTSCSRVSAALACRANGTSRSRSTSPTPPFRESSTTARGPSLRPLAERSGAATKPPMPMSASVAPVFASSVTPSPGSTRCGAPVRSATTSGLSEPATPTASRRA